MCVNKSFILKYGIREGNGAQLSDSKTALT